MGLDIICGSVFTCCSYSYIHKFKRMLILATIEYLRDVEFSTIFVPNEKWKNYTSVSPHDFNKGEVNYEDQIEKFMEDKKRLMEFLQNIIEKDNNLFCILNYKLICSPKPYFDSVFALSEKLDYFGVTGLKTFVDHSDCEGFFSPGQSMDILCWFARIAYKPITSDEDIFFNDWVEILTHSVENRQYVRFC